MKSVVISSGHGKYVSGARGLIDEVTEARSVVKRVVEYLRKLDVTVYEYHDNTSKTQNDNLKALVKYHNSKTRELDVSVHFNSGTKEIGGVEVFYYDEKELAAKLSSELAKTMGIRDRGAKQRKELYFLKNTKKPAILIEVCFVDCKSNTDAYGKSFDEVCKAIAETIANKKFNNEEKENVSAIDNKEQVVSPFAKEAHKWVKENGISDGSRPLDPVTREEVWVMLRRIAAK